MTKSKRGAAPRQQGGPQTSQSTKPKFDKKKWREKKYSNKFKVTQWEKRREKAVVREYYKQLKKDPLYSQQRLDKPQHTDPPHTAPAQAQATSPSLPAPSSSKSPNFKQTRKKLNSYEAAKAELGRIAQDRQRQKDDRLRRKQETEARLAEYRKKRAHRYCVLSKSNHKGQPVMKGRIELLYQQIKKSVAD